MFPSIKNLPFVEPNLESIIQTIEYDIEQNLT